MLSEDMKEHLILAARTVISEEGIDDLIATGPSQLIQDLIDSDTPGFEADRAELVANRREAEQVVAGVLGMT